MLNLYLYKMEFQELSWLTMDYITRIKNFKILLKYMIFVMRRPDPNNHKVMDWHHEECVLWRICLKKQWEEGEDLYLALLNCGATPLQCREFLQITFHSRNIKTWLSDIDQKLRLTKESTMVQEMLGKDKQMHNYNKWSRQHPQRFGINLERFKVKTPVIKKESPYLKS